MAATRSTRSRHDDVSRWVLTSIALSLLIHVLIVHYLGAARLFDVEGFTSSVSRWFHIVDLPESVPPEIASYAKELPQQADKPEPAKPSEIPLIAPKQQIEDLAFPGEKALSAPAHTPSTVRLPDSEQALIHSNGGPDVDETNAEIGEVAPVRAAGLASVSPAGTGGRDVLQSAPGIPTKPKADLAPESDTALRPAESIQAPPLAAPAAPPSPVAIDLAAPEAQGFLIPIDTAIAHSDTEAPPVIVFPGEIKEPPDSTPVIPLSDEVAVKMDMYAKPGDPLCYFRIEIAVAKTDKLPVIPKDVMFICDVSLSMRRAKILAVREAVAEYLAQLRSTDRFNVVVFSEEARKLFPDFVEPTPERISAASAFIDRIPGQIKTDVYRVLNAVVRDVAQQSIRNRPTNIFFVSDGRSTSGVRDARRIVNEISAYSRPNFAILPFDAGSSTDRYLLDLLAYRSRGQATFADEIDGAAQRLASLFKTFDDPTLMQLRLLYTNLDVADTYPAFLPNLYAHEPIVIYGRCKPGQNVTIQLQGKNPYARRDLTFSHTPSAPDPARSDIAREWARRKIHQIVSDIARVGETPELKAELERISRDYNVRTPYSD